MVASVTLDFVCCMKSRAPSGIGGAAQTLVKAPVACCFEVDILPVLKCWQAVRGINGIVPPAETPLVIGGCQAYATEANRPGQSEAGHFGGGFIRTEVVARCGI